MPRPRRSPAEPAPVSSPAPHPAAPLAAVPPEPPPVQLQRTPARQRLADAIETVRQLEAEADEASAAVGPAREAVWAAQRALEDAEDMLRLARPREPSAPAYRPAGDFWGSAARSQEEADRLARLAEAPPVSIADAKAAAEAARDALDSARRLVQHHEGRTSRAAQALLHRRYRISDAVRGVLLDDPALLALARESRRLATRAEAARRAFSAATDGNIIQPGSPFYGAGQPADARDDSPDVLADWAVMRDWNAALEALRSDPDAALP